MKFKLCMRAYVYFCFADYLRNLKNYKGPREESNVQSVILYKKHISPS